MELLSVTPYHMGLDLTSRAGKGLDDIQQHLNQTVSSCEMWQLGNLGIGAIP